LIYCLGSAGASSFFAIVDIALRMPGGAAKGFPFARRELKELLKSASPPLESDYLG
jgi:hypothetical protein